MDSEEDRKGLRVPFGTEPYLEIFRLSMFSPLYAEPILPIRRIRKLRRAPETPGGPLALKDVLIFSFVFEFGQRL